MDIAFESQLAQLKNVQERITALMAYVDANQRKNPDDAVFYGEILLQEIEFSSNVEERASAYCLCGRSCWFRSNLEEAQKHFEKSLEIAMEANLPYYMVQSLTGLGNVFADREEFDEALKYYFEALKNAEANSVTEYMVAVNNNMGEVYKFFKAYDKALEHYQMAEHYIDDETILKNPNIQIIVKENIGEIYHATGKIPDARVILLECIEKFEVLENYVSLASTYKNLAELEYKESNLETALDYFKTSNAYYKKIHDWVNHIPMLISYAKILVAIGRDDEAESHLLSALDYANALKQPYLLSKITSALASFYELHSRYEVALKLYKDFHDNEKKSDRIKTNQRLDNIKARFESEESSRRTEHYRTASNV